MADNKSEGPRYSHVGIVIRKHPNKPEGNWGFRHLLLKVGGKNQSDIMDSSPAQFFVDDPHSYRFGIAVPTIEMQHKIRTFILNTDHIDLTHNPAYNSIAYPFVNDVHPKNLDMNSNQYVLHAVVAAALPEELKSELARKKVDFLQRRIWNLNFEPDHLWVGTGSNLGGNPLKTLLFGIVQKSGSASLRTIPKADGRREYDNIVAPVVTFESMVRFFDNQGWLQNTIGKGGVIHVKDYRDL